MIFVFGSINMDLVARVPAIARPGETVLSSGYTRHFGGKGANQAVAAARAGHAASVAFCGAVGDDAFGAECVSNLSAEGIDVSRIETMAAGTGCAFISVDKSGENAITVASGANLDVRADLLEEASLSAGDVVVLQMEVPFAANLTVAVRARGRGARVVLNFAPARTDIARDDLRALLGATDILVVNQHEAETLAGSLALAGDDPVAQLATVLSAPVIVTLGAAGTRLVRPDVPDRHSPARAVDVVDTTGAGDTFVGVLSVGIADALPLETAIDRAGLAASLACTKAGAQAGAPTRRAIDDGMSLQEPAG